MLVAQLVIDMIKASLKRSDSRRNLIEGVGSRNYHMKGETEN